MISLPRQILEIHNEIFESTVELYILYRKSVSIAPFVIPFIILIIFAMLI